MGTTRGDFLEEVAPVDLVGQKNSTPWRGAKSAGWRGQREAGLYRTRMPTGPEGPGSSGQLIAMAYCKGVCI